MNVLGPPTAIPLLKPLVQHVDLSLTALLIALAIALPVGFAVSKSRLLSNIVLGVLGTLYTIPSLALLALLVPFVGLGTKPALIALVIYAQFVLLRNIVLGFQSVDPAVVEAARGMGLDTAQLFWRIEFPLALPLIIGGIRLAAIAIIAMASIAAWVNAGGLGTLLFEGIYQNDLSKTLTGTVLIAGFAILLNQFLLSFEKDALAYAKGTLTA